MNLGPLAPYSGINGQFYSLIEHFGYLIVFFGVMLGTVGIRFPSAAILLTSGVLIQQGHLGRGGTVAFGVLGAIVGNQLGYWVGHRAGRELVFKWGRYVKLTPGARSGWNSSSRATAARPSSRAAFSRPCVSSKRWWRARGPHALGLVRLLQRPGRDDMGHCGRVGGVLGTTTPRVGAIRSLGPDCLPLLVLLLGAASSS
jgi:hypothetical protein